MAYIEGEGRNQGTLFPVALDDLVPANHICRVIDAFVELLNMEKLGFERSQAAETGRPGYDPRTLLKLYLYCYLNQIRSSRRLSVQKGSSLQGRTVRCGGVVRPSCLPTIRPNPAI
jgi:transposase